MIGNPGAANLIGASRLYLPDARRASATHCRSVGAWEALLARSRERPDEFRAEVARELDWMRPWDAVREGHFPHFKYFVGGVGNSTVNLLDRHLTRGADNRLALIWEGEGRVRRHGVRRSHVGREVEGARQSSPRITYIRRLPCVFLP